MKNSLLLRNNLFVIAAYTVLFDCTYLEFHIPLIPSFVLYNLPTQGSYKQQVRTLTPTPTLDSIYNVYWMLYLSSYKSFSFIPKCKVAC